MRLVPAILIPLFLSALVPANASSIDGATYDEQSIKALAEKASQAQPREQCFLYAELVHQMTEFSVRQYADGDVAKATGLLTQIRDLAKKIHLSLAGNDKRLKNAEILLRHTAFRLNGMLHASSVEDRPAVAAALTEINQAQNEAMLDVFRK